MLPEAATSPSPSTRRLAESGDSAESQESAGSPGASKGQPTVESCYEAILAGTAGPECAAPTKDALAGATQALEAALGRQAAAGENKERTAAAVTEAHRRVTKAWTDPTVPEAETAEARIGELMLARYKLHHRYTHAPGDLSLKKDAG